MSKNEMHRLSRIARHEAAHLTVGRSLGAKFGGATIEEHRDLGFSGLCWGPDFQFHLSREICATAPLVEKISALMPRDGDAREDDAALIHQHAHARVVELTAGSEAEKAQFGNAWEATDDRRQEREFASLIYSSREAQDLFTAACAAEARAILQRHADVLEALTAALLEHRTIDGTLIDEVISRTIAARQLAQEHERRRNWQKVVARANAFKENCHG